MAALGGLLLVTAFLYAPSLSWGYVYEDSRAQAHLWTGWRAWLTATQSSPTRSLGALTWLLVDADPWWQRVASLILHLFNGALLWIVARHLRFSLLGAIVATGVFLLHPVQRETVAYVANRPELLLAGCVLLAMWCVERGWHVPAFVAAVSAIGAKEAGVVALALVPLWAIWRGRPTWTSTTSLYWSVACWPLLLIGLDWVRVHALVVMPLDDMTRTLTAWTLLLGHWIVPIGLSIDPDWARLTPWPVQALVCAGWGVVAGMLWQARGHLRTWPALIALWTLLLVLPRVVWQLGEGLHVHHLYTASIVLSLATGRLFLRKDTA